MIQKEKIFEKKEGLYMAIKLLENKNEYKS